MLCLSGFELYSRWVPLKVAGLTCIWRQFSFFSYYCYHFISFLLTRMCQLEVNVLHRRESLQKWRVQTTGLTWTNMCLSISVNFKLPTWPPTTEHKSNPSESWPAHLESDYLVFLIILQRSVLLIQLKWLYG